MEYFKNLSVNKRIIVISLFLIVFIFSSLTALLNYKISADIITVVEQELEYQLNDIITLANKDIEIRTEQKRSAKRVSNHYIGQIEKLNRQIKKLKRNIVVTDSTSIDSVNTVQAAEFAIDTKKEFELLSKTIVTHNRKTHIEFLKKILSSRTYYAKGYSYIVDNNGYILIHPTREDELIAESQMFKEMSANKNGLNKMRYFWPPTSEGKWKIQYYIYVPENNYYVSISIHEDDLYSLTSSMRNLFIFAAIISIVFFLVLINLFNRPIINILHKLNSTIETMANGRETPFVDYQSTNEIGKMAASLNLLIGGLSRTAKFAKQIEDGKLSTEFKPLSEEDILGNSLLSMQQSLLEVKNIEQKQQQETERRNWKTHGLANFGDILRANTNNLQELSYTIISSLVKYIKANQGGIFLLNDEDKEKVTIELLASYAYDRRKFHAKKIMLGEGLLGTCALERKVIYMTRLPEDYIEITSGLGLMRPRTLLIVPLILEEEILGILELASLSEKFEQFEIDFVVETAENIASTLASTRINQKTILLLRESQKQAEEMALQEDEMRQNMEELQATQEESARREAEVLGIIDALDSSSLVAEYGIDGQVIRINKSFADLLQIPQNKIESAKHSQFTDTFSMSEYPNGYDYFWKKLSEGNSKNKTSRLIINGKLSDVWISEVYSPIFDQNNNTYKVLNIAEDISVNKHLEHEIRQNAEALQASEDILRQKLSELEKTQDQIIENELKLRGVFNALNNSNLVIEFDLDGNILEINDNFLQFFGRKRDDMLGKNLAEFKSGSEFSEEFDILWNKLRSGKSQKIESRTDTSTGSLWLSETYTPILDKHGNPYKILTIAVDITENKQQQEQLKKNTVDLQATEEEMMQNLEMMMATQDALVQKDEDFQAKVDALYKTTNAVIFDNKGNVVEISEKYGKSLLGHYGDLLTYETLYNVDITEFIVVWQDTEISIFNTVESKRKRHDGTDVWYDETYVFLHAKSSTDKKILMVATDISARKNAEVELAKLSKKTLAENRKVKENLVKLAECQRDTENQQAEINIIMDNLSSMSCTTEFDLGGNIINANSNFGQIVGNDKLAGQKFAPLIKMQVSEFESIVNKLKAKKQVIHQEHKFAVSDRTVWLSSTYIPIIDSEGNISKILYLGLDVSKNKEKEEKLEYQSEQQQAAKEELYQNLEQLNQVRDNLQKEQANLLVLTNAVEKTMMLGEYDAKGVILKVNQNYCNALGYSEFELISKNIRMFVSDNDIEEFEAAWKKICSGEVYQDIVRSITKNKDELWLIATYTPTYDDDGELKRIVFLGQDVSAAKQMEIEAQKDKKEFHKIETKLRIKLDELKNIQGQIQNYSSEIQGLVGSLSSLASVLEVDENRKVIRSNKTFDLMFDQKGENLVGQKIDALEIFEKINFDETFVNTLKQGRQIQEQIFVNRNGQKVFVPMVFSPIFNSDKEIVKIYCIGIDLTQLHQDENICGNDRIKKEIVVTKQQLNRLKNKK